jgi:hypothetical protein
MEANTPSARTTEARPAPPSADVGLPDGPAAAALLATGLGSLVLAILVVIAEASESFANSLAYNERVGPLSGKVTWAVVAYVGSWLVLWGVLRRRAFPLATAAIACAILVGLALIGTFSPFFQLFASD